MKEETPNLQVIEGGKEKCPSCGSYRVERCYGMAGGGMGVYSMCLDCDGPIFNKTQDDDEDL